MPAEIIPVGYNDYYMIFFSKSEGEKNSRNAKYDGVCSGVCSGVCRVSDSDGLCPHRSVLGVNRGRYFGFRGVKVPRSDL